jgi:hypothetical protein
MVRFKGTAQLTKASFGMLVTGLVSAWRHISWPPGPGVATVAGGSLHTCGRTDVTTPAPGCNRLDFNEFPTLGGGKRALFVQRCH